MCPSASGTWCTRWKKPSGNEKAEISARMTRVVANIKLPADVHLHAPGTRSTVKTVEQALGLIERELPPEMARLSRRLFARALLIEAQR